MEEKIEKLDKQAPLQEQVVLWEGMQRILVVVFSLHETSVCGPNLKVVASPFLLEKLCTAQGW